ncbi:MAG: bactofilin family protein [Candidatus Binatia bacterium]
MSLFRKRSPRRPSPPKAEPRAPQPVTPPPPPPQFLRDNDVRTSLGPDAVIAGRLSFTTPTRVEGKLKGELRCTDLLIIGPTAVVEGLVKAAELRIEGLVRGDVVETRKVEIAPSGRLFGTIRSSLLVVHDGGVFEGECRMEPDGSRATQTQARG